MSGALKPDIPPVDDEPTVNNVYNTPPTSQDVPAATPNGHIEVTVNGDHAPNGNDLAPLPVTPPLNDVKNVPLPTPGDVASELPHIDINKIEKLDADSTMAQAGTPLDEVRSIDSANSSTSPSLGEVTADVPMEESVVDVNGMEKEDMAMDALQIRSPASMEVDHHPESTSPVSPSGIASSTGMTIDATVPLTPHTAMECSPDDEDQPPPAKRPRTSSNADQVSLVHSDTQPAVSSSTAIYTNGASSAASTLAGPSSGSAVALPPSTLTTAQFRFAQGTLRTLKKLKDAVPFLRPVDPIAFNIPHYPTIIKNPMDFSTIERKLNSSNPAKPDPNPQNPRYLSADAFISDVRLIFHNCLTFNGPDHAVTAMGKRVEEVFDKQLKQMPAAPEPKPVVVKKATPPPVSPVVKKQLPRRQSTSVPVIRRSDTEAAIGRPKREIHPPPPKDLPYADAPKKPRRNKRVKDDGTLEQLRFCSKLLIELHRKQHYSCAHPFYEPVDWVKLEIPTYPKIVKKPMDLSTMRRKLEKGEYSGANKFYDDFKLMIRNCFAFNPAGTPVNQAGIELQRLFDEKWANLPSLHEVSDDEDDDDDEDDSEVERLRAIAAMESQIETMRGSIAALKKPVKKEKKKEKRDKGAVASSSKNKLSKKTAVGSKKKGKAKSVADDDVLTFEQKKDLSEAIQRLDGTKLEKVIQIIHEGVPEIRDAQSTEEIELEIDLLPATVLTKLYNYVLRPLRTPVTKRKTGKGTGTGGLKRKSMDEVAEAEKIRLLEERMRMFESGGAGVTPGSAAHVDDSESDSSSVDSSGSESE